MKRGRQGGSRVTKRDTLSPRGIVWRLAQQMPPWEPGPFELPQALSRALLATWLPGKSLISFLLSRYVPAVKSLLAAPDGSEADGHDARRHGTPHTPA